MNLVNRYMAQGMKRDIALFITKISKHQYYYKPKSGKKAGRPKSVKTIKGEEQISNNEVVDRIKQIQLDPDLACGYKRMTNIIQLEGYQINHKKINRMMKEELLLKEKKRTKAKKKYAQYRKVKPERPLQVLEMDIKLIFIAQRKSYAQILTILDTFTRVVLHWQVGFQMTQYQVKKAIDELVIKHLQPADLLKEKVHIEMRNDNGPQFSARQVRQHFADNHIDQVFTHPYTPQENGHVESFHSILKTSLGEQAFWSLGDLEDRLEIFYQKYNHQRVHGSIAGLPPMIFWESWEQGFVKRISIGKKKVKFSINIPLYHLSEKVNLREVSCSIFSPLDGVKKLEVLSEEVNGPNTPMFQPSDQRSPSVVSC